MCANIRIRMIILFLIFAPRSFVNAQNFENCKLITAILKNDMARRTFKFDRFTEAPIVFVDQKKLLEDCYFEMAFGREVKITTDSQLIKQTRTSNIIIHDIKAKEKTYTVTIEQQSTGALGFIELKYRRDRFVVSKFAVGYY